VIGTLKESLAINVVRKSCFQTEPRLSGSFACSWKIVRVFEMETLTNRDTRKDHNEDDTGGELARAKIGQNIDQVRHIGAGVEVSTTREGYCEQKRMTEEGGKTRIVRRDSKSYI